MPTPEVKSGRGSVSEIGSILLARGCRRPLIVTDAMLVKHGLVQRCVDSVKKAGCEPTVFDKVVPNPHSELVEEGFELYTANGCDSIVAFGGGSPMDAAKVIGAKASNPMPVMAYQGYFRATLGGLRPMPPFVAVPTTAGTGSETTMAAIITIKEEGRKIMIADLGLVPHVAVLDPELLEKLPKSIAAATGMDALTHAVESFLSGWSTPYTRQLSCRAVGRIFGYLEVSHADALDLQAREEMLQAAYEAGLAFTRANVGYVHAIAHQLGAMFHTPHGEANAMLLPHVLDLYLEADGPCIDLFCELAVAGKIVKSVPSDRVAKRKLAVSFVSAIRGMNERMGISLNVETMKPTDVVEVATRALREAHGELHSAFTSPLAWVTDLGYPTPLYMSQCECETIVRKVLPASAIQSVEVAVPELIMLT